MKVVSLLGPEPFLRVHLYLAFRRVWRKAFGHLGVFVLHSTFSTFW